MVRSLGLKVMISDDVDACAGVRYTAGGKGRVCVVLMGAVAADVGLPESVSCIEYLSRLRVMCMNDV